MVAGLLLLAQQASPLLETIEGDMPIVLSAPHGGTEAIPGAELRQGEGKKQFVTVRDINTDKLARLVAAEIQAKTGHRPWLCVAHFSRKYCDANRSLEQGAESAAAQTVHREYHAFLRRAVDSCHGKGLMIDFHGQGKDRTKVFRGTQNLSTWTDRSTLVGAGSVISLLSDKGWSFFPARDEDGKESPSFDGGYTVRTYGRGHADGVDAVQFEFGGEYTAKARIQQTAKEMADAIVSYIGKG
ncbi:MAG: hypothetical protein ABUL72_01760 [Armatimonadota bacterium]